MATARAKKVPEPKVATLHVGTAIRRLVDLEYFLAASHVDPPHVIAERDKLEEALNKLSFDMGFTCELEDGLGMLDEAEAHPNDTAMEILKRDAHTSCCRVVLSKDMSRVPLGAPPVSVEEPPIPPRKKRPSSRSRAGE